MSTKRRESLRMARQIPFLLPRTGSVHAQMLVASYLPTYERLSQNAWRSQCDYGIGSPFSHSYRSSSPALRTREPSRNAHPIIAGLTVTRLATVLHLGSKLSLSRTRTRSVFAPRGISANYLFDIGVTPAEVWIRHLYRPVDSSHRVDRLLRSVRPWESCPQVVDSIRAKQRRFFS